MERPWSAVGGLHWHSLDSVPSPGSGQREYLCAGVPKGVYSVGLLGAKTEIPAQVFDEVSRKFGPDAPTMAGILIASGETTAKARTRKPVLPLGCVFAVRYSSR